MKERQLSATGPATPAAVWEAYADLDRWATWAPQISGVRAAGRRLVPGLTGTVLVRGGARVRFRVTDVDPVGHSWSWTVRLGPVRMHLHHEVSPHPRGSWTGLRMRGAWPVVTAYAPLAQLALHRLVRVES
ncbi:MAG: hypothetical protein JWP61_2002 [Friedmanniella sp.]|nr:hypothetical protein [Friedmanniella sp.]